VGRKEGRMEGAKEEMEWQGRLDVRTWCSFPEWTKKLVRWKGRIRIDRKWRLSVLDFLLRFEMMGNRGRGSKGFCSKVNLLT